MAFIPTIFVLGLAALLAWQLTARTALDRAGTSALTRASRALVLALVAQSIHFIEELTNGFTDDLAALTGLPTMPDCFFVGFNVAWIVVWTASRSGLKSRKAWALFAAWFLAVAGIANGVLHPVLSWIGGGYFAGTYSAPVVGLICVLLALRLRSLSEILDP